jgi:hypothetical protein
LVQPLASIGHAGGGTMPILPAGHRSLSPGSRAGLGAALVLLAAVSALEFSGGRHANYVGLLAAVPFLAAVFAYWPAVLVAGALATVAGLAFATADGNLGVVGAVNVLGVMLATGIAAAVATIRQRQNDRIAELLRLAAVAQEAVLRPIGPQVGSLAVAGRWRPLRSAGHAVRGADHHRGRARQGPGRGPAGQHRPGVVPACRVRAG